MREPHLIMSRIVHYRREFAIAAAGFWSGPSLVLLLLGLSFVALLAIVVLGFAVALQPSPHVAFYIHVRELLHSPPVDDV